MSKWPVLPPEEWVDWPDEKLLELRMCQLGVTIDFGSASTPGDVSQKFARTSAGHWMRDNGWKFGWVLSYPSGETSKTCYYSEPWHYRYVGRDIARCVRGRLARERLVRAAVRPSRRR